MNSSVSAGWWPKGSVIRIDDISIQTDPQRLSRFLNNLKTKHSETQILLAVSVGIIDTPETVDSERVFPPILNAMSDYRNFFRLTQIGIPSWLPQIVNEFGCQLGSHGLIHVDHRLMGKEAQELSIVTSTSVLKTDIFVPPFNKYNKDTIDVCAEHEISPVIWENGWKHLGYQEFKGDVGKYYLHMHDFDDAGLNLIVK